MLILICHLILMLILICHLILMLILMRPCRLGRRIIARARVFVKGVRTEKLLAHPP
jgi:hypothetical protein